MADRQENRACRLKSFRGRPVALSHELRELDEMNGRSLVVLRAAVYWKIKVLSCGNEDANINAFEQCIIHLYVLNKIFNSQV